MCISELIDELKKRQRDDIEPEELLTELHKKFAVSFSAFLFVFIGIPLAIKTHRSEKSISLGISLALLVVYWLLLAGGTTFALKRMVPPWFGTWLPNMIIAVCGCFLFYDMQKK